MELDTEKLLENAIRDGVREAVKSRFTSSYQNPIEPLIASALAKHAPALTAMLTEAIGSCLGDTAFREQVAESVRGLLAKQLVQKFGGELEKQVNQLKSDPATRAKITLAITDIVRERTTA